MAAACTQLPQHQQRPRPVEQLGGLRDGTELVVNLHPSLDPFYVSVWVRAARAAGFCELAGAGGVRLAPHMDTLLLDTSSPAYLGGTFTVLEQYEDDHDLGEEGINHENDLGRT